MQTHTSIGKGANRIWHLNLTWELDLIGGIIAAVIKACKNAIFRLTSASALVYILLKGGATATSGAFLLFEDLTSQAKPKL